ncbi:MAG: phosphonate metabolism protein/1,5-bisphosphokinase (PRPP-forming) PhnN [Acidovorax sp.]|nr:phosphonate metabolism protein/1,5-bisphosphokinase (PRPP-forming) PhnN [Acidovorax sp.]
MTARLIYFMGPSGAGKDSLLDWLRAHLAAPCPVHWAQRTISRPAVAGGEAYESVSPQAFAALCDSQSFALHWEANGLGYGIRHAQLAPLQADQWVLLNGSRAYLADALARFPQLVAVHITASPEVLRSRLLSRGRETPHQVEARVQRAMAFTPPPLATRLEVHNDGTLDDAGQQLLHTLQQLPDWPPHRGKLSHSATAVLPACPSRNTLLLDAP